MSTEAQVFISYSRRDSDFVRSLQGQIEARGINAWVDWEEIRKGEKWWDRIVSSIEGVDAFVFVISPNSLRSKVCGQEIDVAVANKKRIIAIEHRPKEAEDPIHKAIGEVNWVPMHTKADISRNVNDLIEAVNMDLVWLQEHRRLLVRARQWVDAGRPRSRLLSDDDLQSAEVKLRDFAGTSPEALPLHHEYVQASRAYENRRRRRTRFWVILALIVMAGLTIASLIGFNNATRAEATAVANAILAQQNAATAEANESLAKTQEAIAVENEQRAIDAQATALAEAEIALSRQLAAQSKSLVVSQPDLAMLLAVEAFQISSEGRGALLTSLRHEPHLAYVLSGFWGDPYYSLFYSNGGSILVYEALGNIIAWDLDHLETRALSDTEIAALEPEFPGTIAFPIDLLIQHPNDRHMLDGGAISPDGRQASLFGCRRDPGASPAAGCDGVIYVFQDNDNLVSPADPAICRNLSGIQQSDIQFQFEQGVFEIWSGGSAAGAPDYRFFSADMQRESNSHAVELVGVDISPEQRVIATLVTYARHQSVLEIILWDMDTRQEIESVYTGNNHEVFAAGLRFQDEGARLAVCGEASSLMIETDPRVWAALACKTAFRTLLEAEWAQYIGREYAPSCGVIFGGD